MYKGIKKVKDEVVILEKREKRLNQVIPKKENEPFRIKAINEIKIT